MQTEHWQELEVVRRGSNLRLTAMSSALHSPRRALGADRRWWTLAVLCLSLLLIVAANTSLVVALPSIQRGLGTSSGGLQWIMDAYSLVFAALLLPAGALADRYGRKYALQTGLATFGLSALLSTFATSAWELIALRALMGAAAALIMPGTLSVLANVFPDLAERRRAIAIWAGCAGLGGGLGPVISGLLLRDFWWGSTFLLNVPIVVLALVAGWFLVPNSSDPAEAKLDPLGAVLAASGLGLVVFGIVQGPEQGWLSSATLAAIFGGALVLALFVRWEQRVEHPMLDMSLFKHRTFTVGATTITLQYLAMYGLFFAMPQYLQIAHGYSPLMAAAATLPVGLFSMIGAPMSAARVGRWGARRVVGIALIASAAGLALLGWITPATPLVLLLVAFAFIGNGMGHTTAPSTTLIMSSVPRAKSGVGSAVNDLSRELGGALGIAVLGSLTATLYRNNVHPKLAALPVAARHGAEKSVEATIAAANRLGTGHSATLVEAARHSFAHAVGLAMVVGSVVTLVNAGLVWSLQRRPVIEEAEELVQASIGEPVRSTPHSERQSLGTRPPRNEPESSSTLSTERVAS